MLKKLLNILRTKSSQPISSISTQKRSFATVSNSWTLLSKKACLVSSSSAKILNRSLKISWLHEGRERKWERERGGGGMTEREYKIIIIQFNKFNRWGKLYPKSCITEIRIWCQDPNNFTEADTNKKSDVSILVL